MTSHASANDIIAGDSPHKQAFLAHEIRNLVNIALLSFDVLKMNGASVTSDKGQVLRRSLNDLRTLINRSLLDVRAANAGHRVEVIDVDHFIDEIEGAASLEARTKGIRLVVAPVMGGLVVEADRQGLAAACRNLLQNAIKFTKPETSVVLRVVFDADRVRIEVEDECGGLPGGSADGLFRPFEQRGEDRSGLGLGLAFSRTAVEASGGTLCVRNHPGHGCAFVIDLPGRLHPR